MLEKLSYYLYDEWKHNYYLQLIKKTKSLNKIRRAIENWRKDTGTTIHLVKANSNYAAKALIRIKELGWSRDKIPESYKGEYIETIKY